MRPNLRVSWLLAAGAAWFLAATPGRAQGPPEMDPDTIRRITEEWRRRVRLVVADGGPCRVDVEHVVQDPQSLFRKRRVGCAVYVGGGRHFLTTASVAGLRGEVEIFSEDGQQMLARVVGADRFFDLALLETFEEVDGLREIQALPVSQEPRAGMPCLVLGTAYGRSFSATLGRLGGTFEIEPAGLPVRVHRVFASIYPGDSGGLIVDSEGRFVGIVTGVSDPRLAPVLDAFGEIDFGADGSRPAGSVGFAVPAHECARAWEDLPRFGFVRRGFLGVQIGANQPEYGGVRVLQIVPGGPAERSGVLPGDVVTNFGDVFVASARQFCALAAATAPDAVVDLRVLRDDQETLLTVQIGLARERPGLCHVPLANEADSAIEPAPGARPVEQRVGR